MTTHLLLPLTVTVETFGRLLPLFQAAAAAGLTFEEANTGYQTVTLSASEAHEACLSALEYHEVQLSALAPLIGALVLAQPVQVQLESSYRPAPCGCCSEPYHVYLHVLAP